MINFLFIILFLIAAHQAVAIVRRPERFLFFPGAVLFAYLIFVMPQIGALCNSLERGSETIPSYAVIRLLIMAVLCLVMAIAGFYRTPKPRTINTQIFDIDHSLAVKILAFYCVIGFYFYYRINTMEVQLDPETNGWTGIATIYATFAQVFYVGTAGILILTLKKRTLAMALISAACFLLIAYIGIVVGRRAVVYMGVVIALSSFYFVRKHKPNRFFVIGFTVFTMLMTVSTGQYRKGLNEMEQNKGFAQSLNLLVNLDLVGNFKEYVSGDSILEMRNAAYYMQGAATKRDYGFGRRTWNEIIFRFVPAQILGREFKSSLYLDLDLEERLSIEDGFVKHNGTTISGIADAYWEFGYFGCLIFYLIGRMMRFFWELASRREILYFQVLYIMCLKESALAVTHGIGTFIPSMLYFFAFTAPILWLSHRKRIKAKRALRGYN